MNPPQVTLGLGFKLLSAVEERKVVGDDHVSGLPFMGIKIA